MKIRSLWHAASPAAPRRSRVGTPAPAVAGVDPAGEPATASIDDGLLMFLTSSCRPCRALWAELAARPHAHAQVTVVTPDPSTESRRSVARLAAGVDHRVLMSTRAWLDYGVPGAPWLAAVAGGVVRAEGSASSWAEVETLGAPTPGC